MKKNVASQVVGAQMVSASDGSAFTGTATVVVTVDGGTQSASGGTGPTHEGNGFHTYLPTQAETNGDHVAFTFTGTGAIPVTVQVYTTFPQTGDSFARLGAPAGASVSADIATVDSNVDAILVDTGTTLPGVLGTPTDFGSGTSTIAANLQDMADNGTATYDRSTDSLQALRDRGDAAWTTGAGGTPPQLLQSTTIATLASQTSFTLTAGSADDDAYNGAIAVITDSATSTQKAVGSVSDYTGSTKTVTLSADPGIFTMAVGDTIEIIAALGSAGSAPTAAQVADAVWDEARADHVTAGTFGEGVKAESLNTQAKADVNAEADTALTDYDPPTKAELDSGLAALNDPTAAAIADAVLDEALSGHTTAGTLGKAVADIEADATAILADTNELQGDWANGGRLDLILDARASQTTADAIETDTQDIQSRLPAALVSGRMSSDAVAISGNTTAADNLEASALGIITGSTSGTPTTTSSNTDLTGYADDELIGRVIVFTGGTAAGQASEITDYASTSGVVTYTAITTAPAASDTFVIV